MEMGLDEVGPRCDTPLVVSFLRLQEVGGRGGQRWPGRFSGEAGMAGIGGNGRIQRRGCRIRPRSISKRRRERIGATACFLSKYRERER